MISYEASYYENTGRYTIYRNVDSSGALVHVHSAIVSQCGTAVAAVKCVWCTVYGFYSSFSIWLLLFRVYHILSHGSDEAFS